ncbi:MAG: thioredoxin family protein [Bacteroidota bacterium]
MKKTSFMGLILLFMTFNLTAQNWLTNYEEAIQVAKQENKNMVMVFAGSDWCAPCIKLEKYIWESEDFIKYSEENWVLLKLDFPRKKANKLSKEQQAHNDALAGKYNKKGYFPLVLFLDDNGNVLGETGYKDITPQAYINHLKSFE